MSSPHTSSLILNNVPSQKVPYSLGILGAGTVGGGLVRLMQNQLGHPPLPILIGKVGVRDLSKPRAFKLPPSLMTEDLESIVKDPTIDIVVEALGGLEPARTYLEKALISGKHVVTANKYVVSESGDHLMKIAEAKQKHFLYEASIAGSIPIVRILKEFAVGDRVKRLLAILNGTSNFILTRMTQSGESLHKALAAAHKLGIAEADPSFDISGQDAGQKLSILVNLLNQSYCSKRLLEVRGIEMLLLEDIEFATRHGWVIKPMAIYEELQGQAVAWVEPLLVSRGSMLASVQNEYNVVCLDYLHIGRQILMGKGAGEMPTASAIYSDIAQIVASPLNQTKTQNSVVSLESRQLLTLVDNPIPVRFYVRVSMNKSDQGFCRMEQSLANWSEGVLCVQKARTGESGLLQLVTRPIPYADLLKLLDEIKSYDLPVQLTWLRILESV